MVLAGPGPDTTWHTNHQELYKWLTTIVSRSCEAVASYWSLQWKRKYSRPWGNTRWANVSIPRGGASFILRKKHTCCVFSLRTNMRNDLVIWEKLPLIPTRPSCVHYVSCCVEETESLLTKGVKENLHSACEDSQSILGRLLFYLRYDCADQPWHVPLLRFKVRNNPLNHRGFWRVR